MECLLLDFGNDITPKKVNQIYSSFDIYLTDVVDIRILISCLRCLRNPTETIIDKLKAIFDFFDINRAGYIIEDDLYDISSLLCITDVEREVMEKLTQNTFQHKLCNNEEGVVIYFDDFCDCLEENIEYTREYQELLELRLPKSVRNEWAQAMSPKGKKEKRDSKANSFSMRGKK